MRYGLGGLIVVWMKNATTEPKFLECSSYFAYHDATFSRPTSPPSQRNCIPGISMSSHKLNHFTDNKYSSPMLVATPIYCIRCDHVVFHVLSAWLSSIQHPNRRTELVTIKNFQMWLCMYVYTLGKVTSLQTERGDRFSSPSGRYQLPVHPSLPSLGYEYPCLQEKRQGRDVEYVTV